jgi:OOP family OmpA-OmpF porin
MKGIIFLLSFFFITHFNADAQLRVAIVGGAHQSTVLEKNDLPDWETYKQGYSGRIGAHLGFIADMPLHTGSHISFQPGIIFYNRGRKFSDSVTVNNKRLYQNAEQFINYIDFPLNVVAKLPIGSKAKFIIGGGPYGSFFYTGKETRESYGANAYFKSEVNEDLPVGDGEGKYRVLNFGVNALAGVEFGRVFITANYNRSLNDFYKAKDYTGEFKHQVIGATLGIFLGKAVVAEPKIKDKDKDGIADDKDGCPTVAGPAITNGCPDRDADGIADKDDKCPDQAGPASNGGCPVLDRDKDGVADKDDRCPDVAGLASLQGCPVTDRDHDGIADGEDKCPDEPGLGRFEGCPAPDTDKDGIKDEDDKCPDIPGIAANDGCPARAEVKKEIVEKVNYAAKRIQFKFGRADLLPVSNAVLNEVAAIMQKNPELKLTIEGHTSTDASYDANMKLSQKRAENVKQYLESKAVAPSRLTAIGYGPTQPLNEGKTEAERALNRRVELKLSN